MKKYLPNYVTCLVYAIAFAFLMYCCSCSSLEKATKKSAGPITWATITGVIVYVLVPGGPLLAIPITATTAHVVNELQDAADLKATVKDQVEEEIQRRVDEAVKKRGKEIVKEYVPQPVPYIPLAFWAGVITLVVWVAFRFRKGIGPLIHSILVGAFKEAGTIFKGIAIGGDSADVAKNNYKALVTRRQRLKRLRDADPSATIGSGGSSEPSEGMAGAGKQPTPTTPIFQNVGGTQEKHDA